VVALKKFKSLILISITSLLFASCSNIDFLNLIDKTVKQKKEAPAPVLQKQEVVTPKIVEQVKPVRYEWNKLNNNENVKKYCKKVNKKFLHWGWGLSRCNKIKWHHVRNSVLGDPLIWVSFGDESRKKKNIDTTMVLCGVHGDEITPIKFCFDLIYYLIENYNTHYSQRNIVVAPIVNPDSFFKKHPTRTNHRHIDINRNFPTADWNDMAIRLWKKRYRSDKRRFPGNRPLSEPEVVFQVNLIKRYKPSKIISVHAPLTMLDYDGPTLVSDVESVVGYKANALLKSMSQKAKGYRVKDYPFFPGSLGNYAGNERGIPTFTLELPSSDNRRHKEFWKLFKPALQSALLHDLRDDLPLSADAQTESNNI